MRPAVTDDEALTDVDGAFERGLDPGPEPTYLPADVLINSFLRSVMKR